MRFDQANFIIGFRITASVRIVVTIKIGNRIAKSFANSTMFSSFTLIKSDLGLQVARQRPTALSSQCWKPSREATCQTRIKKEAIARYNSRNLRGHHLQRVFILSSVIAYELKKEWYRAHCMFR
jgi:hypothetical protein